MGKSNFLQILLDAFLQFTPWVQVITVISMSISVIFIAYFTKEVVAFLCDAFVRRKHGFEEHLIKDTIS